LGTKRIRKNRFRPKRSKKKGNALLRGTKFTAAVIGAVALSIFFIFCHDFLTQLEAFTVESITLTGNQRLTQDTIYQQSQIHPGTNIFGINLTTARKNLLAHPWIEEVHIQREIPDGIRIHIREYQAVAVIDLGRKFLLNETGVLFKELEANETMNLPVVHGLSYGDVHVGDTTSRLTKQHAPLVDEEKGLSRSDSPYEALVAILAMGGEVGSAVPNNRVERIEVDREIGITIHMTEGPRTIKLGYGDYSEKYALLHRLLAFLEKGPVGGWQRLETVDLNNLNRIVVLPVYDLEPDRELQKDSGEKENKIT
jgi:cell division protein FtsQ